MANLSESSSLVDDLLDDVHSRDRFAHGPSLAWKVLVLLDPTREAVSESEGIRQAEQFRRSNKKLLRDRLRNKLWDETMGRLKQERSTSEDHKWVEVAIQMVGGPSLAQQYWNRARLTKHEAHRAAIQQSAPFRSPYHPGSSHCSLGITSSNVGPGEAAFSHRAGPPEPISKRVTTVFAAGMFAIKAREFSSSSTPPDDTITQAVFWWAGSEADWVRMKDQATLSESNGIPDGDGTLVVLAFQAYVDEIPQSRVGASLSIREAYETKTLKTLGYFTLADSKVKLTGSGFTR
ncbi:MAG: hypothetical protein FWD57_04040 [Polyangiaceae bacterium]|nr:hypothetical protein [Polyangiaceae bacterium]